jgi:hypothetical protein
VSERIISTDGIPASLDAYPDLTRVEVIDSRRPRGTLLPARVFTADQRREPPFDVVLSWQDEGRTLKVFLSQPEEQK